MSENKKTTEEELRAFEENPYNPDNKKPEDIIRLFYSHDVPVIPVVSKRGILLGVIKKEDAISELSDIERVSRLKIDKFITKLARKMSFDDLLPYGKIREFVVINLFGELQGKWSRLQLFTASESHGKASDNSNEMEKQKEDQILEWMIYLILEHIPRALYAINKKGKTIFYNSHFEDIYEKSKGGDVDSSFVEKAIKNSDSNELCSGRHGNDICFYNRDLDIYYEKIPLMAKDSQSGFLIFCSMKNGSSSGLMLPGTNISNMSLSDMLAAFEKDLITDILKEKKDIVSVSESLKISRQALQSRIKKFKIKLDN